MEQPQFFIGQDVVFSSDGYSAAVRILGAEWDADAKDWHYRYQANNEHDGWFYQTEATHFVPLAQDWESIEAQTKSANVYAINS
jgi:hypothetical protein